MGGERRRSLLSRPTFQLVPTPLVIVIRKCYKKESQETRMMVLSDGRKLFQIGLAVLIQYRRVTDSHPARHVAVPPVNKDCAMLSRRAGNKKLS